jgi:hypothetical protein
VSENHVDLPPVVAAGFCLGAVIAFFGLRPPTVKILYILELRETPAVGANEDERIGEKAYPGWLIEHEFSGISQRFLLVIEKCVINALFRQYFGFRPAAHCALEPAFNKLFQVFE